jgi:hypothetical protein
MRRIVIGVAVIPVLALLAMGGSMVKPSNANAMPAAKSGSMVTLRVTTHQCGSFLRARTSATTVAKNRWLEGTLCVSTVNGTITKTTNKVVCQTQRGLHWHCTPHSKVHKVTQLSRGQAKLYAAFSYFREVNGNIDRRMTMFQNFCGGTTGFGPC